LSQVTNPWSVLGIAPTRELRDIKRAYAARLKQTHPEDDPEGFQRLRAAYEQVLALQARAAAQDTVTTGVVAQPSTPPAAAPPSPRPHPDSSASPRADSAADAPDTPLASRPQQPPRPVFDPLASAQALLDELSATPAKQRPAVLLAALQTPEREPLDARENLHRAVLYWLSMQLDRYEPLVDLFMEHYEWSSAARYRNTWFEPRIIELLQRRDGRRWVRSIEAGLGPESSRPRQALALLRGPVDEPRFRRFSRWSKNNRTMRDMLDVLQHRQPGAARYEINGDSARWWLEWLRGMPWQWDSTFALALVAAIVVVFGLLLAESTLTTRWHWSPLEHPRALVAAGLLGAGLGLGLDWLRRWVRRRIASGALDAAQRWHLRLRHDAGRQRWLRRLAAVALLCCLIDWTPLSGAAALLSTALLAHWYSLRYALWMMAFTAWPLHGVLWLALTALLSYVPELRSLAPGIDGLWFAHLLAAFAFAPLSRALRVMWQKIARREPGDAFQFTWYASILLCVLALLIPHDLQERRAPLQATELSLQPMGAVLPAALAIPAAPKLPVVQARELSGAPLQMPKTQRAAPVTVTAPAADNGITQRRLTATIEAALKMRFPRIQARFDAYQQDAQRFDIDASFTASFVIEPSGKISNCRVLEGKNRNLNVEKFVCEEVAAIDFGSGNYYSETYTLNFKPRPRALSGGGVS
jgi:curved DNA-binding protein CbpA